MVHRPLVALGIWFASVSGGVQLTDAPTFVAIVPLALPKECTVTADIHMLGSFRIRTPVRTGPACFFAGVFCPVLRIFLLE